MWCSTSAALASSKSHAACCSSVLDGLSCCAQASEARQALGQAEELHARELSSLEERLRASMETQQRHPRQQQVSGGAAGRSDRAGRAVSPGRAGGGGGAGEGAVASAGSAAAREQELKEVRVLALPWLFLEQRWHSCLYCPVRAEHPSLLMVVLILAGGGRGGEGAGRRPSPDAGRIAGPGGRESRAVARPPGGAAREG